MCVLEVNNKVGQQVINRVENALTMYTLGIIGLQELAYELIDAAIKIQKEG